MPLRFVLGLLLVIVLAGLDSCFSNRGDEGKLQYTRHCASCHLENGEGLRGVIPPLKGSGFVDKYPEQLPGIIRNGLKGPVQVNGIIYNQEMPGNTALTAADVTNIINYMHREFGSPKKRMALQEVRDKLKD